jgi:prepilin-type N-terminal cleavage/methylation domain-containing protein
MKTSQDNRSRGFTIIEVMIVLAVAGLILAVVLLAVPALQRTQRNNARRSDAVHIAGLVSDYVSNHGGSMPPAGAFSTAGENFSQLTTAPTVATGGTGYGSTTQAVINTNESCNSTNNSYTAQVGAMAIGFQVEAAGGNANICIPG